MALWSHSDASYLSVKHARSRAGAIFFLGQKWDNPAQPPIIRSKLNGLVHVICTIIRHVVCSAAEAEIAAAFLTAQAAVPMRITLEEMGHPQTATPIVVDNSTCFGFANDIIKQKRSKAIDMKHYWLQDRTKQGQFFVLWSPGDDNEADYVTKHHPPTVHKIKRPVYLHVENVANNATYTLMRGCNNPGI